ncbi:Protein MLP1-like protein [Psilocybe cubensis]|uniref:Nucleoprotein TPR/MLP1 domain-containing protein n=2 Tax=Psilocybe cubensis TaxID=181762 RepID=A0A8H7XTA3_PSICU|nr:Protein MLP1-like protein [Psilocybe cubensis]KAH9480632.1 Protein MLP1-like protein [Psilocybe cubensis]
MMKTRRKSKAAAAEQSSDGPEAPQTLHIVLPDDVDEDTLTDLLPDVNLTALSTEDVVNLYRALITQAVNLDATERERDEVKADLERKDVELDQALQDKESSSKDLESTVEKIQEELEKSQAERSKLAEEKMELESQLTRLSTSQSSSSTEVENLKRRVDDTEREKRELVGVISRLKDEGSQRDEEIQALRANLKEARQEHQFLEGQVRELRSTETATKFKIDSLTQQLQLAQAEAERANNELTAKSEEFAKYRRSKHAEIATLQASYDSATQSQSSLEASFKALQSSHTSQGHQLSQALNKVQTLTGQLAEQEARYSNEADGLKRLVSMMEEREKQAKDIVESIEREWATVGEKAEKREFKLREEIEREKRRREEAEKRLEELEGVLERIGRGELPTPGRTVPSPPFRTPGTADMSIDGIMGLSPTVAMASRSQRSGKTFTEVYADYVRLQEEYAKKCAENDHMDRTLSAVLAQIEERAPILSQQRIEYERLQVEASQLGSQLSQAIADRDSQANLAQEQTQKLNKLTRENQLFEKQLEDLGRQVQALTRELTRRDDPTIPPDDYIENLPPSSESDTQTLITENLVVFRSISQLQTQNQRLLRIVRDLGEKLESEERDYREAMEKEQAEAIREAHEAMQDLAAQLERQKQSSEGIIQAYVKERDTLKAMLARQEKMTGSSTLAITNGDSSHPPETELAKELQEIQSQFEAYKTETDVDSGRLRDQLANSQREVNSLGASLAKANAKIEYISSRLRNAEEQFEVHNREINDLGKRNSQLHEQNIRFDIECNRLSEELQDALGSLEQFRNECANLRAEKKIWESVQGRLIEENRSLAMERSHLSDLMSNVQKMHNDLERSGENDRRRLEGQLQLLESQTQDLRAQVVQERDSLRHLTLQKDLELKELQNRLEKKSQECSTTRESLVEAQTSRKHLEEKVEDLAKQLKGNEEKLAVYERRPSAAGAAQPVDQDASREQQLETEVAELRATLKVTEVDLAAARSHRDQYQEISQASEAALASLNSTFDEYKASSEAQITRQESEIKALQERLDQATQELATIRTQLNDAQKSFEAERTSWINDKKTLEDTIVDMSTSEKHSESDRNSREHELRNLEDRAKAAEERYSHEIIAHAESMKTIEGLKKEVSKGQAAVREHITAAETAKAKLASSENSWRQQKDALDKEVADLNARCQDLSQQNTILHEHLESVSAQAARIRQAADAPIETTEGDTPVTDKKVSELMSVLTYLRKEKGIVDLQLEMSKRENEVLKSQINRVTQTLEETRATLAEERERAVENTASAAQHAELVERINQLNILRESNATLRAECESASKKARDLETKLNQLSQELEPAKEQARSAQAELEITRGQMQRLEQESRRWQERNTQLLSKYDRIDPSEVQALKDEIAQLKSASSSSDEKVKEKDAEILTLSTRIEALEQNLRAHRDSASKNTQAFRAKLGELNQAKSALTEEKRQLEAKVASLEQECNVLKTSKPEAAPTSTAQTEELQKANALITTLQAERDRLLAEKEAQSKTLTSTDAQTPAANWEAEKAQLVQARDEAIEKLKTANAEVQKANNETRSIKFQNDKFQARIQDLMKTKAADAEKQAALVSEVEKAKADLASGTESSVQEELKKRHADELKALEDQLKVKHEAEMKARIDSAVKEALQSQPPPQSAPTDPKDQQAAIDAALAQYKKELEAQHAAEIASAVDRGRMEAATKGKLKDSQLVRAQKRVKDLEAQIQEWQAAGIVLPQIIATSPAAPPPAGAQATQTVPTAPTASTSAATTTAPATQAPPNAPQARPTPVGPAATAPNPPANANAANLPRRPPNPAMSGALGGRGGPIRGMGRGGPPLGAGRGAPLRTAPVKPQPSAPISGGVSIMGAAKRPREEPAAATEDSLAKRLKPAEPAARANTPVRRPPGADQ